VTTPVTASSNVKNSTIDEDERLARMLQEEENLQFQRERVNNVKHRQNPTVGYDQVRFQFISK
jgi:hypothetical protein